jgi:hypothetical protein
MPAPKQSRRPDGAGDGGCHGIEGGHRSEKSCGKVVRRRNTFTKIFVMNTSENPYEPPPSLALVAQPTTPDKFWRIRFAVSMWVCGVVAIQCIPVYPWNPESWADRAGAFTPGIHVAWLAPFCCSVASVACAIGLFRLPSIFDKVGAFVCISLVGLWPGFLALHWWLYFAIH